MTEDNLYADVLKQFERYGKSAESVLSEVLDMVSDPDDLKELIHDFLDVPNENMAKKAAEKYLKLFGEDPDIQAVYDEIEQNNAENEELQEVGELEYAQRRILHNKYRKPPVSDFFDLVRMANSSGMCLNPGCTTCGCMQFRNFCKTLGKPAITEMLKAIPEEYIGEVLRNYRYRDPLRIIMVVFRDFSDDIPVIKAMHEENVIYETARAARIQENEEKTKREMAAREERIRIKFEKHSAVTKARADERNKFLENFTGKSLPERLTAILDDDKHTAAYYSLDYDAITDEELLRLPTELLQRTAGTKKGKKDKEWNSFRRRVKELISADDDKYSAG